MSGSDTINDLEPPYRSGDSVHADRGHTRERLYDFMLRMHAIDGRSDVTVSSQDWLCLLHLAAQEANRIAIQYGTHIVVPNF